jgi:hypothetical protein
MELLLFPEQDERYIEYISVVLRRSLVGALGKK